MILIYVICCSLDQVIKMQASRLADFLLISYSYK